MASTQQSTFRIFFWLSLTLLCAHGQQAGTKNNADAWPDIDHRLSLGSPTSLQSTVPRNQACQFRWQPHCSAAGGALPPCAPLGSPAAAALDNACITAYTSSANAPDPQVIFAQLNPIDAALDMRALSVTANSAQFDSDATVKFDPALGWRAAHGSLMPFSTATLARWHADRWINASDLQYDSHQDDTVRYF